MSSMRGVNLGGWLILEKWMTPSLFAGTNAVDEYTFMQTANAANKIEKHRKTFITEEDFKWLQQNGITAVRIPVGYWLFQGDSPYTPTINYLDWAMKMSEKYQLKVLIDLHGLRGSQNGKDHSGRIGKSLWQRHASYRQDSITTLEKIAERYKDNAALWGIEVINEPKYGLFQWKLRQFYRQAYNRLAAVARPGVVIVFHDGFTPRLMSGAIGGHAKHPVMMDIHWYHFGSPRYVWQSIGRYFKGLQTQRVRLLKRLQHEQPVIIGEWSITLAGEKLAKYTVDEKAALLKRHGELQIETYAAATAWFYWTYKTEGRGMWHFRSLVEDKIISLK